MRWRKRRKTQLGVAGMLPELQNPSRHLVLSHSGLIGYKRLVTNFFLEAILVIDHIPIHPGPVSKVADHWPGNESAEDTSMMSNWATARLFAGNVIQAISTRPDNSGCDLPPHMSCRCQLVEYRWK